MTRPLPLPVSRLLNQRQAAAYCGVSVPYFLTHFHIQPVEIGSKKLFDVKDIDHFIDERQGHQPKPNWLDRLNEGAREGA